MALDVSGINKEGANEMKSAIEKYKNNLNRKINKIAQIDQSVLNKAIKGSAAQKQFNDMLVRVRSQAIEYTKKLNDFESALDTVIANYSSSEQISGATSFGAIAK